MTTHNAKNERIKRQYLAYLREAKHAWDNWATDHDKVAAIRKDLGLSELGQLDLEDKGATGTDHTDQLPFSRQAAATPTSGKAKDAKTSTDPSSSLSDTPNSAIKAVEGATCTGSRNADENRNRAATAAQERDQRLRSKGIQPQANVSDSACQLRFRQPKIRQRPNR